MEARKRIRPGLDPPWNTSAAYVALLACIGILIVLKGEATTALVVVVFSSAGSEEDLSSKNSKKGSKKKAVDRSQAIVKWAGGEAASTGVSAAMVAAGITTLVAPTVAVRERERERHADTLVVVALHYC